MSASTARSVSSAAGRARDWSSPTACCRLIEVGDEVLATYASAPSDGSRLPNTEILTFDCEKISQVEVYFGWDLP
jgi:hypothetical protein